MTTCPLPRALLEEALGVRQFCLREIRGGISKRVYEVDTGAEQRMLYLWLPPHPGALTENRSAGAEALFPEGLPYLLYNTRLLENAGVRTPKIFRSGRWEAGGASYAIVERLQGVSLEQYRNEGGSLAEVSGMLTGILDRLASCRRAFYGPPLETEPYPLPPERLALRFYKEELRIASEMDPETRAIRSRLESRLERLAQRAAGAPLGSYGLIHGELTPQHVFLLEDGGLALIDIEGAKYFDEAYEWAVVGLHYGQAVQAPAAIDRNRLELYRLCLQIGYLSTAVEYLAHVDDTDRFFQGVRDGNLAALQKNG